MASRLIELSDERLARLVNRGDEAAFEALYDRHHAALLAFCRHMAGNREDGEDALQQTFLRAHRALRRHRPPEAVRPWLFAIARNRCRTLIAARGAATIAVEDLEPSYDGLAEDVARRADLRQLVADLSRLPDDQRGALVLFELGGMDQAQIATVLGCPPGKVKALVYQARSELIAERDARSTPCDTIRLELSVASGGALRRGPLRRHLRACDGCREYRELVATQRVGLASVIPVPSPVLLKATILAGLFGGGAASHGAGAGAAGAAGAGAATTASSGGAAGAASSVAAGSATGGAGVATGGLVVAAKLAVGAAIAAAAVTGGAGAIGHSRPDGRVLAQARQVAATPAPARVARRVATATPRATVAAPRATARPAATATATAAPSPAASPDATPTATPAATAETARAVVQRRVTARRRPARHRRAVTGQGVAIVGVITPTPRRKRPAPTPTPAPGASATPTPAATPVRRPRARPRPAAPVTPRPRPAVPAAPVPVPPVAPPVVHPRPRVRPAPTPTPEPAATATATATPEATPTPTPAP